MNANIKKNIALVVSAVFLLLALFDGWPYDFFTLLRFIVFASSAYVAWIAFQADKSGFGWLYAFLAILFNPFILISFERETWMVIDAIVAVFNISSIWMLKVTGK